MSICSKSPSPWASPLYIVLVVHVSSTSWICLNDTFKFPYTQLTYLRPRSSLLLVARCSITLCSVPRTVVPHSASSPSVIYIDDLFVLSDNNSEHELHLGEVISLLRENGLIVRPDNCTFAVPTVDFLGHRISLYDICPL